MDRLHRVLLCRWRYAVLAAAGIGSIIVLAWERKAVAADPAPTTQASLVALPPATKPVARRLRATADHARFPVLQQAFKSAPDVTAACLSCHTEASKQVMKTSHWTWAAQAPGASGFRFGKAEKVINNFCIALGSNEPRCTSCHSGYGWKDKSFDFTNENLVDCLVCHDTTGQYKKFPTGAGFPATQPSEFPPGSGKIWQPPNLSLIAQNVGRSSRQTCGACHFFGGGGEGVKHGDMDESLGHPKRSLDVHMADAGPNMDCTECHTTIEHKVAGRYYTIPAVTDRHFVLKGKEPGHNYLACESCHTTRPHKSELRNDHARKVACQTCHIPGMARERPTKMWWDWSKAGQKKDGKAFTEYGDVKGNKVPIRDTQKGEFVWIKDEAPEYRWFDGNVSQIFVGDKIDDKTPASQKGIARGAFDKIDLNKPVIQLNWPKNDWTSPNARIWPVKVHRGVQPYDSENKTLIVPKLFGKPGSGAYWGDYDWAKANAVGMKYNNQPYSGKFDWIQTEMFIPLSHMVAPEEQSLKCDQCHSPQGRLAGIGGVYLPGRDGSSAIDVLGIGLVGLVIAATVIHGILRGILSKRSA